MRPPSSTLPAALPALTVLALTVLALTVPALAAAQPERSSTPAFAGLLEVSEVLVDVLATGPDGEVARGLDREDFIVEEGGREMELTSVWYSTTRYGDDAVSPEGIPGEVPGEVPGSRYFVLLLHDVTRAGAFDPADLRQVILAVRDAQRWVAEDLRGSDWVAIASYGSRLRLHQDFTQDRDALLFALEEALARRDPEKTQPRRRAPPAGRPSLLRRLPAGQELRRACRDVFDALRLLAGATDEIVGRKNVLLLTHGVGRDFELTGPGFERRHYLPMTMALNDHNLAVYPIHLGGRGVGQPSSELLSRLAEDTGGLYAENLRSFHAPMVEISDENYGYYVLSYRSAHPAGEIGYAEIEVRAVDPAVKVRARKGYRYGL